jgi:exosortase
MRTAPELPLDREPIPVAALLLAGGAFVWAYWSTLAGLAWRWNVDPQYSHGFVVPLVAAGLIWLRRDRMMQADTGPSWLGLPLVLLAAALRLGAARLYFEWLDWLSVLPAVAGLVLLCGGRGVWKCAWPGVLFLSFMLPMPYRLETALAGPLQSLATTMSTFCLQTLGFPAVAEGNLIIINESTVGVAEACSGLRMLVVFVACAAAVAIVVNKPLWERGFLLLSAFPIAIICNVTRITVTGILFETVGRTWGKLVFHDLSGWLMMIMAVAMLKLEVWCLNHALIAPPPRAVVPVQGSRINQTSSRTERGRPVLARMPDDHATTSTREEEVNPTVKDESQDAVLHGSVSIR